MPWLRTILPWSLVVASLVVSGCGGGGDGSDTTALGNETAGPTTVVGGSFMATDGATPLASALVYVEGAKSRDGQPPQAVACGTPPDPSWPAACTGADGSFSLEVALPANDTTIVMVKNGFTQRTALAAGRPAVLALGAVSLARAAAGARIAVVIGDDAMQQPLARMGLGDVDTARQLVYGTESFKVYDSELGQARVQARREYPAWSRLFVDRDGNGKPDIHDYAVVIFNSALYVDLRASASHREALRTYVREGGRIVTSGNAYLLVEDLWPTYLDWGGTATADDDPERPPPMRSESFEQPIYGMPDVALRDWLAASTCTRYLITYEAGSCFDLPADSLFAVDAIVTEVLPNSYARLLGPHAQSAGLVRTLVQGYKRVADQVIPTHPLAVTMTYGTGRIAYLTFRITPIASIPTGLTPHERVLQYLVFEM